MRIISTALRNIGRRWRRTILTGFPLLIGGALICFGLAFGDGVRERMLEENVLSYTGHVQIRPKVPVQNGGAIESSFSTVTDWRHVIRRPGELETALKKDPAVQTVLKRILIFGMLSNGQKMDFCYTIGLDSRREKAILTRTAPRLSGVILGDKPNEIYISEKTARSFKVGVGDSLTLISQTADGSSNAMDFTVVGIFRPTAPWMDNSYVNLADAQQLAMLGDGVSQLNVMLRRPEEAKQAARRFNQTFGREFRVEAKDWERAGGFAADIVGYIMIVFYLLWIVLFLVIAATVANTMLMAVHERTREIGTMSAMGAGAWRIVRSFLMEAAVLAIAASGLGTLLSAVAALYWGHRGIPAPSATMRYLFGGDRAYPSLAPHHGIAAVGALTILAVVAALYPAIKAARMKPVEALRS